jgi:hypothetical protein
LRHGIEGIAGLAQKAGNQRTAKDKEDRLMVRMHIVIPVGDEKVGPKG